MKKVRVGLIGLGFMGSTHFRIYRELEDAQIVALADVDPRKRAGDVSSVIGNIGNADNSQPLDMTGVKTYDNGYDLIKDPDVDVVDICVPTPDHSPRGRRGGRMPSGGARRRSRILRGPGRAARCGSMWSGSSRLRSSR